MGVFATNGTVSMGALPVTGVRRGGSQSAPKELLAQQQGQPQLHVAKSAPVLTPTHPLMVGVSRQALWPGKTQLQFMGRAVKKPDDWIAKALTNQLYLSKDFETYTLGDILVELYEHRADLEGQVGKKRSMRQEDPTSGELVNTKYKYPTKFMDYLVDTLEFTAQDSIKILETLETLGLVEAGITKVSRREDAGADHDAYNRLRGLKFTAIGLNGAEYWQKHFPREFSEESGFIDPTLDYLEKPVELNKLDLKTAEGVRTLFTSVKFSRQVRLQIIDHLKRVFKPDGSGGSSSEKSHTWLNRALQLPWIGETQDRADVQEARKIFEKRLYGMERVKRELLEIVALRQRQGGNHGGIILLVGPPGTGKTAVTKVLAEALGRRYVTQSLAGRGDPNEILGHRSTYVGALPGVITKGMMEAGVRNPVFQLDELDKTGANRNGNILDALTRVLDPDQNHQFEDQYFGFPFDLSKVLFVCTANSLEGFPEHLLSRTKIIEVPAYLPEEKLQIAKSFLIPDMRQEFNLSTSLIRIQAKAIRHLIQYYTLESGVRKLDEQLKAVFRKANMALLDKPGPVSTPLTITPDFIDEVMTGKRMKPKVNPKELRYGEVNGLYYSTRGGGILPVQVSITPVPEQGARRDPVLTGHLGQVMQESAQLVMSYIRAHADELGIPSNVVDLLRKNALDIHIHYPDGATPKDGPSAGISTFAAVWSALSGYPVPAGAAFTGEIDLMGRVKAIGGILEKISGSKAQGANIYFLSEENRHTVEDLQKESPMFNQFIQGAQIHYVSTLKQLADALRKLVPTDVTLRPPAS